MNTQTLGLAGRTLEVRMLLHYWCSEEDVMSSGPIEFLNDEAPRRVPRTEYGGDDGLIQTQWPGGLDGEGLEGHVLSSGENVGVRARRAMVPLDSHEGYVGEVEWDVAVDPITGRTEDEELVSGDVTGTGGTLSDLRP